MRIEQRPAGITRVDRGISLNRAFDLPAVLGPNRPLESTDHARGQGPIQSERISDRQNLLTNRESFRITKRHHGQRFFRWLQQANHCEVGVRIFSHNLRRVILSAAEADGQLLGIGDDVIIRQDIALVIDNRSRAGALSLAREQAEKVTHGRRRLNVNNAGGDRFINLDIVLLVRGQRRIADVGRRRHGQG
jgi:hypothetical protein